MTAIESSSGRTRVGILVFDDVEVLDFCGPFEVFSVAQPRGETDEVRRLFQVHVIAERKEMVSCRNGLMVMPHHSIDNHPPLDILLIPGGRGTRRARTNPSLLAWIAEQHKRVSLTTSVCTGAFLLAANGLLDGMAATTHWASIDWLREHHPAIDVREDVRYVDAGRIVTSAGVSAGIDMALHVVERLHGRDVAVQTARHMEYRWDG